MIYTVTFNPSIDYIVSVENFEVGSLNRACDATMLPGGKGLNVSIVLNNLGYGSVALGFTAGFIGNEISRLLSEQGIKSDFIEVDGNTRINVKIRSGAETELNGVGPSISDADIKRLYDKLDRLKQEDILVLAGSIPSGVPDTVYADIMKHIQGRGIKTVVDATGDLLMNTLQCHPFLIKPNDKELGEIFRINISQADEAVSCALRLQEAGAQNVLVSMGEKGAILVSSEDQVYNALPPSGDVVNTVGAGDSMVAGFIAGYLKTKDHRRAFYTGLCAGSASAFSQRLATKEETDRLLQTYDMETI